MRLSYILFSTSRVFLTNLKIAAPLPHCFFSEQKSSSSPFSKKIGHIIADSHRVRADPKIEAQLAPLRVAVKEAEGLVKDLKTHGAHKLEVDKAVLELKGCKRKLAESEMALAPTEASFDRIKLEDLLKRRFFCKQSFEIYGGIAGLFDLGPMGAALMRNMISVWTDHFIAEEQMLEIKGPILVPEAVLKASGHVEKFADLMVKDVETGECFRADHLIKNAIEKIMADPNANSETKDQLSEVLTKLEGYSATDIHAVITRFNMKSPITGNDLTEPAPSNLMFSTQIGHTGDSKVYLRPETAQNIFIEFKSLLESKKGRLPFAAVQIGEAFRNEISPGQGLIRQRQFTMCEIEHFVDPSDKSHEKFTEVANLKLVFHFASSDVDGQSAHEMTIEEAVEKGIVNSETLGYFMARCHQFLVKVGVDPLRIRFRQHLPKEMAHYAQDCWDAEILTSYGWIECVGHADRGSYDLQQHSKATGVKLVAQKKLKEPRIVKFVQAVPTTLISRTYKHDAKKIKLALEQLNDAEVEELEKQIENGPYKLQLNDSLMELTKGMVKVKRGEKKVHVEEIFPSVIEPSYGIGRIMYAVLEHSFRTREGDEQRNYLYLPPLVAPIKCAILPIISNEKLAPIIKAVEGKMRKYKLSYEVDDSAGSIGRRYARADETGTPFGVTVDFDSEEKPWTVTVREAESMEQIRVRVDEIGKIINEMITGEMTWAEAKEKYPTFLNKKEEK